MPPHLANFFIFSRDGFLDVGQAGLELPISGYSPASASQSTGITGVSHRACLRDDLKYTGGMCRLYANTTPFYIREHPWISVSAGGPITNLPWLPKDDCIHLVLDTSSQILIQFITYQ